MTDTFRKEYKPLSDDQKFLMNKIKDVAADLENLFDRSITPISGREIAVAKTHLETAIMWVVKGITK